ncbi:MAG: hypothetical protein PHC78_03490 [Verrucomicrobiota bacterium]|nr:hypothetical protein [Verrucomicrobiota bacterium]
MEQISCLYFKMEPKVAFGRRLVIRSLGGGGGTSGHYNLKPVPNGNGFRNFRAHAAMA